MRNVIERLLNLLAHLLTVDRPVTADDIRRTVAGYDQSSDEAFRRMFERDKDLLRSMGVPLETVHTDVWETEIGYVIEPDDYTLPDPGLTDEERAALWLALQVVRLGGQPSGPEAILKLGGAPLVTAGEPLGADLGLAAEDLAAVFQAISERRPLRFEYRGRSRSIEPYSLLHQRGHWYVVGRSGTGQSEGEVRSFRVDRGIGWSADGPADSFIRPAGFSARDALPSAPWESGEADLEALVDFDEDIAWWVERQLDRQVLETTSTGVRARLRVANPEAFVGWILGFDDKAEVIEPPELRRLVIERITS